MYHNQQQTGFKSTMTQSAAQRWNARSARNILRGLEVCSPPPSEKFGKMEAKLLCILERFWEILTRIPERKYYLKTRHPGIWRDGGDA